MNLIQDLKNAIIEGEEDSAIQIAKTIIKEGKIDIKDAILNGLSAGMKVVGQKYEDHEFFIPEIIISADALNAAFEIFKPQLKQDETHFKATAIIGVVKGDIHEIGKNILSVFLAISGYNVIDLGRNVHSDDFIEAIGKNKAKILCLSTLMTPTLEEMRLIIEKLKSKGIRDQIMVFIGGAPTDKEFKEEIGADYYCKDANEAIGVLNKLSFNDTKGDDK